MPIKKIIYPLQAAPVRLDVFLANHTDQSRTKIQKLIKAGAVKLNGRPASPHRLIHPGHTVTIDTDAINYQERALPPDTGMPAVVFENDHLLVVNKPSGWVVHGGPGIHEQTLADWAVQHDSRIATVGDRPEVRPGIVHRLDRDVSGVMVIAKTSAAFTALKHQFQNHSIVKEYMALAFGRITGTSGRITFAIARKADKSGLMVARPNSQEGKEAETRFTVERYIKSFTLVRIRTLTGRGHQIRVHFKAIGHPLVGDKLYRRRGIMRLKVHPPRIFLHATLLGLVDVDGTSRRFEVPLPADLQQYLARIS